MQGEGLFMQEDVIDTARLLGFLVSISCSTLW